MLASANKKMNVAKRPEDQSDDALDRRRGVGASVPPLLGVEGGGAEDEDGCRRVRWVEREVDQQLAPLHDRGARDRDANNLPVERQVFAPRRGRGIPDGNKARACRRSVVKNTR